MKKLISLLLLSAFVLFLTLSLSACGGSNPSGEELSSLVGEAILADNAGSYFDGECSGEGHRILGSKVSGSRLTVYALTMFGNYGFHNDMFIKISGSGIIPAVLTFERNGDNYELLAIEYPMDGALYTESIRRMFPLRYRAAALSPGQKADDELSSQERRYAEEYLRSIGRDAEIGEYADLNTVLLTELGVSVPVSNKLSCDKRLGMYPYWIGTIEVLKNGTRFVYSLSCDESAGLIKYEAVEKDTGTVIETYVFDALTGEEITG